MEVGVGVGVGVGVEVGVGGVKDGRHTGRGSRNGFHLHAARVDVGARQWVVAARAVAQ